MDKEVLRNRISITTRRTSLFRIVESVLENGVLDRMIENITEHLFNSRYDRTKSLHYISEHLENGLEQSGIDLEDGDTDGIALSILFVYEELLEDRSEFFDRIQEKSVPIVAIHNSDDEEN